MSVSKFHELKRHFRDGVPFPGGATVLAHMEAAPKFVFTKDVIDFVEANRDDFMSALAVAAEGGKTNLARSPMLVEYGGPHWQGTVQARGFWLVEGGPIDFKLWCAIDVEKVSAVVMDGHFPCSITGGSLPLRVDAYQGHIPPGVGIDVSAKGREALFALFLAQALHVRGIVARPPRRESPKLDRAREKRGLPPVTKDYVTVHIGYVQDRHGKRHEYVEGKGNHLKVHLRRGHFRNQAHGVGHSEHRTIWIDPVLVNYRDGVTVEPTNYLVVP